MKARCFFFVNCAVLFLFIASASAESDAANDAAEVQGEEEQSLQAGLPEFPEGVTVKRLSTLGECKRLAVPGNWLELEFFAQQMKDDETVLERFDSTKSRKRSLMIEVGGDKKLPGLYEGLKDVCVGEQREITIQPGPMLEVDTKYGLKQPKTDREAVFTVTIRSIQDSKPSNIFDMMDANKDDKLTREEISKFLSKNAVGGMKVPDEIEKVVQGIMENHDKDMDNILALHEYPQNAYKHTEL